MKQIYVLVLLMSMALYSCTPETDEPDADTVGSVDLTEEMEEFTETVSDTAENLQDIIKKFAESEELKNHDIINQNLSEVKVVSKDGDCYTIETPDSGLTRIYEICWEDGKITQILDKGIK